MTKENKIKEKILEALENLGRTSPEFIEMEAAQDKKDEDSREN